METSFIFTPTGGINFNTFLVVAEVIPPQFSLCLLSISPHPLLQFQALIHVNYFNFASLTGARCEGALEQITNSHDYLLSSSQAGNEQLKNSNLYIVENARLQASALTCIEGCLSAGRLLHHM